MKTYREAEFNGDNLIIDGKRFEHCSIKNCRLYYTGGALPQFDRCSINGCQWTFTGPAENTIAFLTLMYHGLGGAHVVVEQMFNQIRQAKFPVAMSGREVPSRPIPPEKPEGPGSKPIPPAL